MGIREDVPDVYTAQTQKYNYNYLVYEQKVDMGGGKSTGVVRDALLRISRQASYLQNWD
jgi:hypothetical protein